MREKTKVEIQGHKGLLQQERVGEFFIDASPKEVLRKIFLEYNVVSYKSNVPWIINLDENRTSLYLEEHHSESKFLDYVPLNSEEFLYKIRSSRREEPIRGAKKMELAEQLLGKVNPDSASFRIGFTSCPNAEVYSDLLSVLGFEVSCGQVKSWISRIADRDNRDEINERIERTRKLNDLNSMMNEVVG